MSDTHPPPDQVRKAEHEHRKVDPHGKGEVGKSGEDATALPTDDRHDSEKASDSGAA